MLISFVPNQKERERERKKEVVLRREEMDGEGISDGLSAERKVEIRVNNKGRKVIFTLFLTCLLHVWFCF